MIEKYVIAFGLSLLATFSLFENFRVFQRENYAICKAVLLTKQNLVYVLLQLLAIVFLFNQVAHLILHCVCLLFSGVYFSTRKRKQAFVMTKRMTRLIFGVFCALFLCSLCEIFVLLPLLLTVIVFVVNFLLAPFELLINVFWQKKAIKKLKKSKVKVIAIVGSYAKTSTKLLLCRLLENAIATANSVNTPKGICAFINKTDFKGAKWFIAEFGARRVGDIKKLCELFNPEFGVFTGLSECHMQTFKTFENVKKAKCELLEYLDETKTCILNDNDAQILTLQNVGKCKKVLSSSVVNVTDIDYKCNKTFLTLSRLGVNVRVQINLIGQSNAQNVALATSVAVFLGQDFLQTAKRIKTLEQIPHRLCLSYENGLNIIDDSYNANRMGICVASKALSLFLSQKFAICQGIAECGDKSKELNEWAGEELSYVADYLFATGPNADFLLQGAKFGKAVCFKCETVEKCVELLQVYSQKGDVVLFQNDIGN